MKHSTEIFLAAFSCWFIPILLWSVGESAKNWIVSTDGGLIKLRRPISTAAGWIALALLYPISFGLLTAANSYASDRLLCLCFFGLLSLILFAFAVNAAAPRTVILDMAQGTCYETRGWWAQTKKREQAITENARLLFCWTSNFYSLFLQTDSTGYNSRFLLSMSVGRKNADFAAAELSRRLGLPIAEGRLRQIDKL
ncbi:MAG: hypothetical protein ACRYFS_25520 [Janthinobacterium lividum]